MEIDTLIHMANRIGSFFEALPDREEGLNGVAEHLRRYWEPRMRRQLLAWLDSDDADVSDHPDHPDHSRQADRGEKLSPFVREAIDLHRADLNPPVAAAA